MTLRCTPLVEVKQRLFGKYSYYKEIQRGSFSTKYYFKEEHGPVSIGLWFRGGPTPQAEAQKWPFGKEFWVNVENLHIISD